MRKIIALLLTSVITATASGQAPSMDSDLDLISKVKSALAVQPETKALPLTVSVLDGVAVIGGAVPNASLNDKLAAAVREVPGLKEVRVNCWVPSSVDPLAAAVKAKLQNASTITPLPDRVLAPAPAADVVKAVPLPIIAPAHTTVAARGEPSPKSTGYSPVPPPAPPAPAGPSEHETIPPPRVPVKPGQDVAAAVDAVKLLNRRYANLKITATLGTVTIAGSDSDAAWDLAAEVRKVPGVERVIVSRPSR